MIKNKQPSYIIITIIALLSYFRTADASESGKCYFQDEKHTDNYSYYSVDWEIDNGTDGHQEKQFNINFRELCGTEQGGRLILSNREPYSASYDAKNVRFTNQITFTHPDEDINIPGGSGERWHKIKDIEALAYAHSKDISHPKKLWWTINSNDHFNNSWTIHFKYPISTTSFREIKTTNAVCEITYAKSPISIANITPQHGIPLYVSSSKKYIEMEVKAKFDNVLLGTANQIRTCNLL